MPTEFLYGWRVTNWLMAKPWRWRYDRIYVALRKSEHGRLRSLWGAATFPHVHAPWED